MDVPSEMLLHPELLTNEQLIYIIEKRQLKVPDLFFFHRDQLLDLFHNYCVPFGQRVYRDSGRGRVLNKSRHLSPEKPNQWLDTNNRVKQSYNFHERIKPPPDLLSGHMKRIKIDNTIMDSKEDNSLKRKMSIDAVTATNSPLPKLRKKPITWP